MPRQYDLAVLVRLYSPDYLYTVNVTLDDIIAYKLYKERKHLKTDPNYVVKVNNIAMELYYANTRYSTEWITWDTGLELPTEAEVYVKYGVAFMNVKFKEKGKEYENNEVYLYPLRKIFIDYGYYKSKK